MSRSGPPIAEHSAPAPRSSGEALPRWLGAIYRWIAAPKWTVSHWVIAALWLVALLAIQWKLGAGFAAAANPDPTRNDQGAYLRLTADNLSYWWPTATDGIRNPLLPFLLKPWHSADLVQFFEKAKLVNVCFGLMATVAFGIFWLRRFPFLAALNLTTLTALVVTLPGSSWVGAEAVFYVGFFFLWLLFAELLTRNPLWMYAAAGLVAAFTYLAKPSITLLAGIFFGFSLLRALWVWWRGQSDADWSAKRLFLGGGIFVVTLLLPILPRAIYSARKFGNPFQNTAQACMWFDDWPTAYEQLGYLNPKLIQRIPVEKRPSPANFLHRNSAAQITDRFVKGIDRQWHNFLLPEGTIEKGRKLQLPDLRLPVRGRGLYLGCIALLAITFTVANWKQPEEPPGRDQRRAWLWLAGAAFLVHFAAFSFYTPIAGGARFIMSMFLPVLAALAWVVETRRRQCDVTWRAAVYAVFQIAFAGVMIWHLGWLSSVKHFGEVRGAF